MDNKKNTGSYYTPKILSDFLVSHILDNYVSLESIDILEPSCGDGQFVDSLFNSYNYQKFTQINLDLVDINGPELEKIRIPDDPNIFCSKIEDDYLNFFFNSNKRYSLIIGNPPYVRKANMEAEQISRCEDVHSKAGLYNSSINPASKIKNIWPAFIEAGIMSLNDNGILCFVLPSEILQVKYAKELRDFIRTEFDKVEIFAFNELIFEGIEQDVVALIGVKSVHDLTQHGVSFYQVDELVDLKEPKFTEKFSNIHRHSLDKWTNYILSDEELNFIDDIKKDYHAVKSYCNKIEVGIVTAANDYFIVNNSLIQTNDLSTVKDLIKPILPKGGVLPDTINFTLTDLENLRSGEKKVNFICFSDRPKNELSDIERSYIAKGEQKVNNNSPLNERYKMKLRKNWYHVPSIWQSDVLFVKRCHDYPKIFLNNAKALATDSFYRVVVNDKFSTKSLVFSFYNSLTFILAELEGRYYGGGVLELIPSEFKDLTIPYNKDINEEQFDKLDIMFRTNISIETILDYTDNLLLGHLGKDKIFRLRELREKLLNRRLKARAFTTVEN